MIEYCPRFYSCWAEDAARLVDQNLSNPRLWIVAAVVAGVLLRRALLRAERRREQQGQ